MMEIRVNDDVPVAEDLLIGSRVLSVLNTAARPEWLDLAIGYACEEVKCADIKRDYPTVAGYRKLYWRMGLDPTRRRVCTEALIRMACRKGDLPHINAVVDAVNLAILETLTPMSVFDLSRVRPPLVFRSARREDLFRPIGSKVQPLKEGMPVLADTEKVLMVGYASSDSDVTRVTTETTEILVVAYGVRDLCDPEIALERATKYLEKLK